MKLLLTLHSCNLWGKEKVVLRIKFNILNYLSVYLSEEACVVSVETSKINYKSRLNTCKIAPNFTMAQLVQTLAS